ncbi:MAG TPA: DUF433 domain-containing protein [Candidatus Angelobacter sp.]|nr:DUF433 domain-containing protein [Candidatus Angelobacter sp.]
MSTHTNNLHPHYNPSLSAVHSVRGIMGGEPVFRGSRIRFKTLLDHIEHGEGKNGLEEFLDAFNDIPREQALQALKEAGKLHLIER